MAHGTDWVESKSIDKSPHEELRSVPDPGRTKPVCLYMLRTVVSNLVDCPLLAIALICSLVSTHLKEDAKNT